MSATFFLYLMSLGVRLKQFAKVRYGSQQKLAEVLGVRKESVSEWVTGFHVPSAQILEKLAGLRCNANWLLTGEGEMLLPEAEGVVREEVAGYHSAKSADELVALIADVLKREGIE